MEEKKETNKTSFPYNFGMGGFYSPMFMSGMMPNGFGMMQPMMMQNQNIGEEDKQNLILNNLLSIQIQQHQILKLLAFSSMQSDQKVNPMAMQMMGQGLGMGFGSPFGF